MIQAVLNGIGITSPLSVLVEAGILVLAAKEGADVVRKFANKE